MPSDSHSSSGGEAGPANYDRRLTELVDQAFSNDVLHKTFRSFASDPHRTLGQERNGQPADGAMYTGVVVYSVPYCTWFRVQLDGTGATVGCTMGSECGVIPIGPRATGVIPPYSRVTVWMPPGQMQGIIQSVIGMPMNDPKLTCPDWVSQGSGSGILREQAYQAPFQNLYRQGGIIAYAGNKPVDSTTLEWGRICETGVGIHLDPFMTFMRVSEIAGIWFNYFDHYVKFAAWNLDLQTGSHALVVRQDEGENRLIESHFTYPWEGLGLYTSGAAANASFGASDVQFNKHKGTLDLPDGKEDLQPFARYEEAGGYLGQGRYRRVAVPASDTGMRRYSDDATSNPDFGVFEEFVGLDGTYAVRSAKQIMMAKYSLIPVPKEKRLPEDQKTGDDARQNNYKFSGTFGGGASHYVGDVTVPTGGPQHLLQAAGVFDLLAYAFNWQGTHPFYYHTNDYTLPNESDMVNKGGPKVAQETLDFGSLSGQMYMDYPTPKTVKVDARYGDVAYTSRVAYHTMLDDGSQVFGDGYGAEITMTAGSIRLSCPGDFIVTPGRNFTVLAGCDINLRAHSSMDLTAGTKDVRIKAERNLQVLSNNGGVLIESKAKGFVADFDGKIGEDVSSGGVMIKSPSVTTWASNIYMRTGGGNLENGTIVLDSAAGSEGIVFKSQYIEGFVAESVSFFIGPEGSNNNVQAVHSFYADGATIDKSCSVGGEMFAAGDIAGGGGVYAVDGMASVNNSGFVEKIVGDQYQNDITNSLREITTERNDGQNDHKSFFPNDLYMPNKPGNDTVIQQVQFSYRDDATGDQYHATNFQLAESRWQSMARLGLGTGGSSWDDEPVVSYQGLDQLPYPGRKNWNDSKTLLQLNNLTLFDSAKGFAADRGPAYETPSLGKLITVTPSSGFMIIN